MTEELRGRLDGPALAIVDTRPLHLFNGWRADGATRGGHIPGAVAFPGEWERLFDDADLGDVLVTKGITTDREVVLYGDDSWGDPVDVVLDGVGGDVLGPAVRALAPGGRLVAFGSGGGTVDAYELLVRSASVTGFQVAAVARREPERYAGWVGELWDQYATGALRPRVFAEFPLAEAGRAHRVIETRGNLGKVVLVP